MLCFDRGDRAKVIMQSLTCAFDGGKAVARRDGGAHLFRRDAFTGVDYQKLKAGGAMPPSRLSPLHSRLQLTRVHWQPLPLSTSATDGCCDL